MLGVSDQADTFQVLECHLPVSEFSMSNINWEIVCGFLQLNFVGLGSGSKLLSVQRQEFVF